MNTSSDSDEIDNRVLDILPGEKPIQKALICGQGNTYLIALRSAGAKFFPSCWGLLGGKLEPGEDPVKGVEREVMEEADLTIKAGKVVGEYTFFVEGADRPPHRFTLYSSTVVTGDIKLNSEHTQYKWATREEILELEKREPYFDIFFNQA